MALTPSDMNLWKKVTADIKPLNKGSKTFVQGPIVRVASAPRYVEYNPVLDLHGITVHAAHSAVLDHVYQGFQEGYRRLTVITGRSGQINIELPKWLEHNRHVRSINSMNGGGAWEICLTKRVI